MKNPDNILNLTDAQINFFEVEIDNKAGVQPATLESACVSLRNAPDEAIVEWCNDDAVRDETLVDEFFQSVLRLRDKHGSNTLLADLLPSPPGVFTLRFRFGDNIHQAKVDTAWAAYRLAILIVDNLVDIRQNDKKVGQDELHKQLLNVITKDLLKT